MTEKLDGRMDGWKVGDVNKIWRKEKNDTNACVKHLSLPSVSTAAAAAIAVGCFID